MSLFAPKKIEQKEATKHYVIDTCVLLHDPNALNSFQEHNVYLPLVVIEELDKFKKEENEKGRNCRATTRIIDELRIQGPLTSGIKLPNGGTLKVLTQYHLGGFEIKINDDKILATAVTLKTNLNKEAEVILVTNDINMRVRANIYGIPVEPFGKKMKADKAHTGVKEIIVKSPEYATFKRDGHIDLSKIVQFTGEEKNLLANEYVRLINELDPNKSTYGVYVESTKSIQKIRSMNEPVFGIVPKNEEQACALDALMDPDISLVTLIGKAGSGKTLIAVAAALEATLEHKMYDKILIARPVQPMGKDIGYLPGTLEEKLSPWMQPIFDNLEFLFNIKKKTGDTYQQASKKQKIRPGRTPNLRRGEKPEKPQESGAAPKKDYEFLLESKTIQVEALTYIRGRSIPKQFIIIDEAQNLSPHEIKTIITRAGEGTKIVLTGDTQQIDSPYLDEVSNGLTYAVERLKELGITSHVTLFECERSALAEAGTKYL
jgi:PhoH-like ATPase